MAKYVGGIAIVVPMIIYMYYVLIEAWCLGYALNYLNGSLMNQEDYGGFLNNYIGAGADGAILQEGHRGFLLILAGVLRRTLC
ncbi:MAG: hypothetical protein R3C01_03990 [Planctomycetaceae bacterium]